jgi:hypothetical protein
MASSAEMLAASMGTLLYWEFNSGTVGCFGELVQNHAVVRDGAKFIRPIFTFFSPLNF